MTFLTIGILMLLIVIAYTFASIRFLLTNLDEAFSANSIEQPSPLRFNLEKAEAIIE